MTGLHVYALGHTEATTAEAPNGLSWLEPVNLARLDLSPYPNGPDSPLGEGRLLLSGLNPPKVDWVGQLNAYSDRKYAYRGWAWWRVPGTVAGRNNPNLVFAACPSFGGRASMPCPWPEFPDRTRPGSLSLLKEMAEVLGMPVHGDRPVPWANDFVCSRIVWEDFRAAFRECVAHFHARYGFDPPFGRVNADTQLEKKPAYLYELVACLYFAARRDLEVVQL